MKAGYVWGLAILAGVLVWFVSAELQGPLRMFVALLLGPAPVLFFAQARAAQALPQPVPRVSIYTGSIIGLALLGTAAYINARLSDFTNEMIGLVAMKPSHFIAWTVVLLVGAIAIVAAFRRAGVRESALMHDIVPKTARERAVFLLLCIAAGVFEEIVFRGVLLHALDRATGSLVIAMVVSSLSFGVLHAHQNAGGAMRAALLGLLLAVPVVITGSVYASMAAHTLVDIAGGLWLSRWLFSGRDD